MSKKFTYLPVIAGVITLFIFISIVEYLVWLEYDRDLQAIKASKSTAVGLVRARLETEVNSTMFLAMGLSSFVSANPEFTTEQFNRMAATLASLRPGIRNVALAPKNVVRYVYPLKGNENALGLDYSKQPNQRDAVLRMMKEGQPVMAGPINLIQGGQGLVNRIPIYPLDVSGRHYYWGLASIVIDPSKIISVAGLQNGDFRFALRGKDGKGAKGDVIWGDAKIFNDPRAILMDVHVPGGTWQLAGEPAGTVMDADARRKVRHLIGIILAIGCAVSIWLIFRAHLTIKAMALHDPLTGLPNRRYLEAMAENQIAFAKRNSSKFSVLHLDLDDFKEINDRYGHKAGDAILVNVARCARSVLRGSDFIARVGGDEFIIMLPETGNSAGLQELVGRLRSCMAQPVMHDGHKLVVNASIGAAVYPDAGDRLDELVKEADAQMYIEKQKHKQETGSRGRR